MSDNSLNNNTTVNGTCDFRVNNQVSLEQDNCHKIFRDKQSEGPGIYRLNRYNDKTCGIPTVMECASQNPTVLFRDGYGITECYVDDDTQLRIGKSRKNPKCPIIGIEAGSTFEIVTPAKTLHCFFSFVSSPCLICDSIQELPDPLPIYGTVL